MRFRPKHILLLASLVSGMALVTVPSVRAQTLVHVGLSGASGTLEVRFGSQPHWTEIHGTRVMRIEERDCPEYDIFRYGGTYYLYDDGRWYSSRRGRGRFVVIEDHRVPAALCALPREHWRRYPAAWMERNRGRANGHRGHDHGRGPDHKPGKGHGR